MKKLKKLKTLLALCAVLNVGIMSIPVSALELDTPETKIISQDEEKPTSGTCGKNAVWNFDTTTGTLTISGTGRIENSWSFPIQKVVIEEGITEIGDLAFGWTSLTSVTIPSSVTCIGFEAFIECTSLTSITIPDSVTEIQEFAFAGCTGLTSVTMSDSVINIGEEIFADTSWLDEQLEENPVAIAGSAIVSSNPHTCTGNFVIPEGVTTIAESAFQNCTGLTSVEIPDSVTNIGKDAFKDTPWLDEQLEENPFVVVNSIIIDSNWETCVGDIVIPDSVTSIGEDAFFDCVNLTSITIPESVTNIEDHAFFCCENLISVTISSNMTNIGLGSFGQCISLTSVTIPDSVTKVDMYAFDSCENLTSIVIKNPDCEIYDHSGTICNGIDDNYDGYYNGTIYGYPDSTAQAYAEEYGYKFESLGNKLVQGDADGDGELTVADAVLVQKFLLGKVSLPNWESCDLYPDEKINVFDLLALKRKLIDQ